MQLCCASKQKNIFRLILCFFFFGKIKLFLAFLFLFAVVSAMYDGNADVIELTATNFQSKVVDSDSVWIVEFYAPWYEKKETSSLCLMYKPKIALCLAQNTFLDVPSSTS